MSQPELERSTLQALVDHAARRAVPPSRGPAEAVARADRARKMRVLGQVFMSGLLLTAIIVPLVALSGLFGASRPQGQLSGAEPTILQEGGIRMTVPDGWHGRADFLSGYTRKIFQVATFPLPPLSDAEATSTRALIGPDDVLIVMVEHHDPCGGSDPMFPRVIGPVSIEVRDFESPHDVCDPPLPALRDVPADHALARKTFELEGRLFDLRVEFGTRPAPDARVAEVNEILNSLVVGRYQEVPDGLCRRHELGFDDPDCPEPQWTRRILAETGYEVADGGGVYIARGAGTEFYVWAEELTDEHTYTLGELGYPRREEVDGISVFGGEEEWAWRVQGVEVHVAQGPEGDSVFPTFDQIESLVRASIDTPYPS